MAKAAKEPERVYACGFYLTKQDDHTYSAPQGLSDMFAQWNEKHAGLQKMLEGIAQYVAEQRGALYREQNAFWNKLTDALGLPRGTQAMLHHDTMSLKITPVNPEKIATLKLGSDD